MGTHVVRLLPEAEAKTEARRFNALLTESDDPAAAAAAFIAGHGTYWDQVLPEIAPHLLPLARVTAVMLRPGATDAGAREALADLNDAFGTGLPALAEGQDPAALTALEGALDEAAGAFRESLTPLADGARVFSDFDRAFQALALANLRRGMGPEDAAESAVAAVIGAQYSFLEVNGGTVRIPDNGNARLLGPLIEAGMAAVLGDLEAVGVMAPADLAPEDRPLFLDALARSTRFVTADCDNGVVLTDQNGDSIIGAGGKEIAFTWQALVARAMDLDPTDPATAPAARIADTITQRLGPRSPQVMP